MITVHHERGNFWLRVKQFFALGGAHKNIPTTSHPQLKPKRRSHRTTAFFEMP